MDSVKSKKPSMNRIRQRILPYPGQIQLFGVNAQAHNFELYSDTVVFRNEVLADLPEIETDQDCATDDEQLAQGIK